MIPPCGGARTETTQTRKANIVGVGNVEFALGHEIRDSKETVGRMNVELKREV